MTTGSVPWHAVSGFGAHIRASASTITIQYKGKTDEYSLSAIDHLLIIGGHNLHTSVVSHMIKRGSAISFFDPDGTPLAFLHPFGFRTDETMRQMQIQAPHHTYATEIVRASLKSRLLMIEKTSEVLGKDLFYRGEQEIMHRTLDEVNYLIKMNELRRIHKFASDMYYEIMSRTTHPKLEFRQRTLRPHRDPVNAMLSLGYAMLFGNTCVSVTGTHMNPDYGMLRQGERSLILDLIDPLKAGMVDKTVFSIITEGISDDEYECSTKRCHLDDNLIKRFTSRLKSSINQEIIDYNVLNLCNSLKSKKKFHIYY